MCRCVQAILFRRYPRCLLLRCGCSHLTHAACFKRTSHVLTHDCLITEGQASDPLACPNGVRCMSAAVLCSRAFSKPCLRSGPGWHSCHRRRLHHPDLHSWNNDNFRMAMKVRSRTCCARHSIVWTVRQYKVHKQ